MSSGNNAENRVQEVSQISRSLKVIAGDLEVPVIALSQLSRAVESRTDKRPLLSDLRESGTIEQDADLVMFLYRDEYYNEQSEDQGLAEVILAKHRNGPVGTEKLAFLKRFAKFADLAPQHDQSRARRDDARELGLGLAERDLVLVSLRDVPRPSRAPTARSFLEAVRGASVRGHVPAETDVGFVRCAAGHEVRRPPRRPARPASRDHDGRQLQLA